MINNMSDAGEILLGACGSKNPPLVLEDPKREHKQRMHKTYTIRKIKNNKNQISCNKFKI